MDEIDAALDYKNVSIIANYIKDRCTSAQFVIYWSAKRLFELVGPINGRLQDAQRDEDHDPAVGLRGDAVGAGRRRPALGDAIKPTLRRSAHPFPFFSSENAPLSPWPRAAPSSLASGVASSPAPRADRALANMA